MTMTNHKSILKSFCTVSLLSLFFFISCEQVSGLSDKAIKYLGIKSEQTPSLETKNKKKKSKLSQNKKNTPPPTDNASGSLNKKTVNPDIVITLTDNNEKTDVKPTNLKTAVTPGFRVKAPVAVTKRIGGVARFIHADDKYIYMDFPQHFAVYNTQLELLALKPIAAPLKRVKKMVKNSKTLLFLEEENHVLEVLELEQTETDGKKIYALTDVLKKEMEHDYYWINTDTTLVFLKDKIEFLDFSDIENIKIADEAPISNVVSAIALGDYLYLSRNQFLDILNIKTLDLISSIRIGRDFAFAGLYRYNGKPSLALSYLSQNKSLSGLQTLTLSDDYSGISDFGEDVIFAGTSQPPKKEITTPATLSDNASTVADSKPPREVGTQEENTFQGIKNYSIDLNNGFIVGEEDIQTIITNATDTDTDTDTDTNTDADTDTNTDAEAGPADNAELLATTETKPAAVRLYSIHHHRFLRGTLNREKKLQAWSLDRGQLYLVNDKAITINKITIDSKITELSKTIQNMTDNNASVPLAQIGADKPFRDEYTVDPVMTLDFMADSRKVVLLDKNHFISFENTIDNNSHQIFATTDFDNPNLILKKPLNAGKAKYDRLLPTSLGVFAYSEQSHKIFFIDIDFTKIEPLPVTVPQLISWHHFSSTDGSEVLAIASKKQNTAETGQPYEIVFYALNSPTDVKIKATLPKDTPPFVYYVPEDQIVVLTKDKMELYDWNVLTGNKQQVPEKAETAKDETETDEDNKPPEKNKPKTGKKKQPEVETAKTSPAVILPDEVVTLYEEDMDIVSIKTTPALDTVFALIQSKNRYKIFIFDVFNIEKFATLDDFDITVEQFEGSAFSKDGRLFILPSNEGTLFYDVSSIHHISEVAHWSLPSYHAAVADQGKFICVALGYKGIYCGDLLF
ncbi:MAG: hypothetical protein HQM16_05240 [Deltaproteobacteria bacterium]|nr:hypothetical protein [Deltaproteobacteria bacterium]